MQSKSFFLSIVLTIFTTTSLLLAGVTGKIAGRITDATTGDPLIGVNVILKGTPIGAATNENGYYTILNVTGGKYTVVATMIGYKTIEIKNVTVLADHTSTVDIQMEVAAVKGEEVTITAERPIIVRDETATTTTVLAEEIENMPVNSYVEVLDNIAGVVESNNSGMGGGDDGIHIRGGRSNEIAYMVDGFFVEDAIYGGMGTDVSRAGISELSIITGSFNAEYGEAMSGVVNILTKEGGSEFSGHLRITTDQLGFYKDDERPLSDWNTGRFEGSIGGPIPIPFLPRNSATFFLAGDRSNTESYLGRTKHNKAPFHDYNQNGVPDEGEYLTDEYDLDGDGNTEELLMEGHIHKNSTFRDQTRINAKLVFRPLSDIKITAGGIFNRTKERGYSQSFKLFPEHNAPTWKESDLYYLSLSHSLSPRTFYTLKVSRFINRSWEGLEKYMNKKREIWNIRDVSKINKYWNPWEPYADHGVDGIPGTGDWGEGNGQFDWEDRDGDGEWDIGEGEFFVDIDGNSTWTEYVFDTGIDGVHTEWFDDANGNGTWEPGENFEDSNGDGIWNGPDEGERDGLPNPGEEGVVNLWWNFHAEPFLDTPDGRYRSGSYDILVYDADQDGEYDPEDGDYFIDISGDGVWVEGEPYIDLDNNGEYNYGITPTYRTTNFEGLSNYEFWGGHPVYDANGDSVRWAVSEDNFYEKYASNSISYEANFTSQITQHHQIKLGGEYKKLVLKDFWGSSLDGGIWGIASDPSFVKWTYKPEQGSFYIQDKVEFKDWIINLGLRWDYLDPNSEYADPTRKIAYLDPFGNFTVANGKPEPFLDKGNGVWNEGEYFLDENGNGQYDQGEIFTDADNGKWDEGEFFVDVNGDGTWTGAVDRYGYYDEDGNFVDPPRATVKSHLSPRIGIGYPITDRIAFHFSYGQFYQYPEYDRMYRFANLGDPNIYGNSLYPFPYSLADWYIPSVGSPNLKPETTIAYEFGIRWQITNDFVLNSTVFYKDIYDYITSTIFLADPTDYAIFENTDYGNAKGIEFNLRKIFSNNYSFSIIYTFSKAVANAANEYTHWYEAYLASVYGTYPSLKNITMPWDQPHTFNFSFDYRSPKGYGLNLVGNLGSGLPYTPTDARGLNLAESNSGRMPWTSVVDMKAYKDLRFKPITARLFIDVTNLFNRRNIFNVFNNSGKPDESLNPNNSIEWVDRPYYFGPPRHIEAGISILFD